MNIKNVLLTTVGVITTSLLTACGGGSSNKEGEITFYGNSLSDKSTVTSRGVNIYNKDPSTGELIGCNDTFEKKYSQVAIDFWAGSAIAIDPNEEFVYCAEIRKSLFDTVEYAALFNEKTQRFEDVHRRYNDITFAFPIGAGSSSKHRIPVAKDNCSEPIIGIRRGFTYSCESNVDYTFETVNKFGYSVGTVISGCSVFRPNHLVHGTEEYFTCPELGLVNERIFIEQY